MPFGDLKDEAFLSFSSEGASNSPDFSTNRIGVLRIAKRNVCTQRSGQSVYYYDYWNVYSDGPESDNEPAIRVEIQPFRHYSAIRHYYTF